MVHPEWGDVNSAYVACSTPEYYATHHHDVSQWLTAVLRAYVEPPATVFEPGCSSGRNLHYFAQEGYWVTGMDINPQSRIVAKRYFPNIYGGIIIRPMTSSTIAYVFDAVVTSGFLMHVPPEDEGCFDSLSNMSNSLIITNEVELGESDHEPRLRFLRNYKDVFENLGWEQIMCAKHFRMGNTTTRVFKKG